MDASCDSKDSMKQKSLYSVSGCSACIPRTLEGGEIASTATQKRFRLEIGGDAIHANDESAALHVNNL